MVRNPRFYVNGTPIAAKNVTEEDGIVRVLIHNEHASESEVVVFAWECVPFCPATSGRIGYEEAGSGIGQCASRETCRETLGKPCYGPSREPHSFSLDPGESLSSAELTPQMHVRDLCSGGVSFARSRWLRIGWLAKRR